MDMKSNNFCLGTHPNTGIVITADGMSTFIKNSFENMTEVDGVRSRGCVAFKTKAPFYLH